MAQYIYWMRKVRKAHGDKVDPRQRHAGVPAWREDRCGRPQRRRQVQRAQDHGRARPAVQRRRRAHAGLHGRHPHAGAAARRDEGPSWATSRRRSRRPRRQLDRYNEIAGLMATELTPTSCWRRWASCRRSSTTTTRWELDSTARAGDGRAALPAAGSPGRRPVRWRAPPRRALQAAAEQPDLLLLDEPTNHLDAESVQWLEQHLAKYPGAVARRHPRPVLPRQRGRMDPRARPRSRLPVRGQLLHLPGDQEGRAAQGGGPQGREAAEAARARSWSGCGRKPKARQAKSRARLQRYEEMAAEAERTASWTSRRSRSRRARGWATSSSRSTNLTKGFGDRVLITDLSFSLPRNGIVGVIGPNGVGKTTLFKTIVGAGAARLRRRCGSARP